MACAEFVRRLRLEFPHSALFASTATLAGYDTACQKLAGTVDGVFFAPVDYVFAVRRVLRALQPSVVIVAETEIWPNLFRETRRTGASLAIVNGRISDRALPRYRRYAWFFRAVLPWADTIFAQTNPIRDRFLMLGAPPDRTRAAGNFKYDFEARPASPGSPVISFLERIEARKVWIAASTMPPADAGDLDEDDIVLAAFAEVAPRHPGLLLLLVPRKPERFDVVAAKIEAARIPFVRRSRIDAGTALPLPGILLLDTIGELGGLFGAADVVFMGGTLARRGGHNILEPALFGKAVICGPHMENFQAIADEFRELGATVNIGDARDLAGAVDDLLTRPEAARYIGRRARAAAVARRGATARAVAEIRRLYDSRIPVFRPAMPLYPVRRLLSLVWLAGGAWKRNRSLREQRKLPVPVISVGNLTMGGTGKTPCVLAIAQMLRDANRRPGILTRGYGRGTLQRALVLQAGASIAAEYSGDEPQIFLRSGVAPVGIGADRAATGAQLVSEFGVDVLLLDDGFQHWRLARDVDVVLIDALNPYSGGGLFPIGRLREPVSGLSRADVVLITRSDASDLVPAVLRMIRRINSTAPVFYASVEPLCWKRHHDSREYAPAELPPGRPAAFCGLGNPQSFRRTLSSLGVDPVDWVEFEDHHHYRPHELKRISEQFQAQGATLLLTTEKDAINLCDDCDDLLAPLPLYWLRIGTRIDGDREFAAELLRRIGQRDQALR